jgi:hypothetical protein
VTGNGKLVLQDVYVVPALSENLLSVKALVSKGVMGEFREDKLRCLRNKTLLIQGNLKGNLFGVNLIGWNECNFTETEEVTLWHKRLGYASADNTNNSLKHKINRSKIYRV